MKSHRVIFIAAVVAALLLPSTASAADFDFPLKGWWPLNEGKGQTVKDWSGKGNHGYLGSSSSADSADPSWTKGIFFGSALNFGGDDYITIKDSSSLEPQNLTVSAWVKASSSPGQYQYVIAKGAQDCTTASYALWSGWHGGLAFYIWDGTVQRNSGYIASSEIWDGKWHHVAGTYDGTLTKLFVDGKLQSEGSSVTGPVDYNTGNGNTTIGGYVGTCDLLFTGDIDEVHIWSQPIAMDQVWNRWRWLLGIPGRI